MGFGGIIAGALEGGAKATGQIADEQIKQNSRMQYAEFESQLAQERQTALARLQQSIGRDDKLWATSGEGGQAQMAYDKQRTSEVGAAETAVLADRESQVGGIRAKNEGLATAARGAAETEVTKARGNDKGYTSAVSKLTAASHFFGPQDKLAQQQLDQLVKVTDLRNKLAASKDQNEREDINRQINDLTGNTKSRGELQTALIQAERAKQTALKTLSDPMADETAKAQAEESIDTLTMLSGSLKAQLGVQPAAKTPTAKGSPYAEGARLKGPDGKTYIVRGGKPVAE